MLLPRGRSGFSRLDLLALIAGVTLLLVAIAPTFGSASRNTERAVCINNLQQIGSSFAQFWADYGNKTPWQAYREPGRESGLELYRIHFHFAVLSNYVSGPRIFADPADERPNLRIANNWSSNPNTGGFFSAGYSDNAVSYFIGLDVNLHTPDLLLAGDRNVTTTGLGSCASGLRTAANLSSGWQGSAWTDSVHRLSGNLLFCDGSVRQTNTRMLRDAIAGQNYPAMRTQHAIVPWE